MIKLKFFNSNFLRTTKLDSLKKEFFTRMCDRPMKVPALTAKLKAVMSPSEFETLMASTALSENKEERAAILSYANYLAKLNQSLDNTVAIRAADPQSLSVSDWINVHNTLTEQYASHMAQQVQTATASCATTKDSALSNITSQAVLAIDMSDFYELNRKKFGTWFKLPLMSMGESILSIKSSTLQNVLTIIAFIGLVLGIVNFTAWTAQLFKQYPAIAFIVGLMTLVGQCLACINEVLLYDKVHRRNSVLIDDKSLANKTWNDVLNSQDIESSLLKSYIVDSLQQERGPELIAYSLANHTPREALALFSHFLFGNANTTTLIKDTIAEWTLNTTEQNPWHNVLQSFDINEPVNTAKTNVTKRQINLQTTSQ